MKACFHEDVRSCDGDVNSAAGAGAPVGMSACEGCNVMRAKDAAGACSGLGCKPGHAAGCEAGGGCNIGAVMSDSGCVCETRRRTCTTPATCACVPNCARDPLCAQCGHCAIPAMLCCMVRNAWPQAGQIRLAVVPGFIVAKI